MTCITLASSQVRALLILKLLTIISSYEHDQRPHGETIFMIRRDLAMRTRSIPRGDIRSLSLREIDHVFRLRSGSWSRVMILDLGSAMIGNALGVRNAALYAAMQTRSIRERSWHSHARGRVRKEIQPLIVCQIPIARIDALKRICAVQKGLSGCGMKMQNAPQKIAS